MRKTTTWLAAAALAVGLGMYFTPSLADDNAPAYGENLLAFIGQKIGLSEQASSACKDCIIMDAHYLATYRIVDIVYGNYRRGSITFDVYDHYGTPAFSRYETVLLFVSQQRDGTWMHEKYQYYDLHKGVDGEWYGCGDPYQRAPHRRGTVQARPVQFPEPVSYLLDDLDAKQVEHYYPADYFEIRNGRAYCMKGTPVKALFEAKKETVLAARGIFK